MAQGRPDDFSLALPRSEPIWDLDAMLREVFDDRERRAVLREEVEDHPHGVPNLFIGIQDDLPRRIDAQAHGEAKASGPVLRLFQLAADQTAGKPMKFGFTHGPPKSQQQALVVLPGIVNPILVNDEGIGEGADLNQPIPITARPRQTGGFQTDHGPRASQPYFGNEMLKARAADGRGS